MRGAAGAQCDPGVDYRSRQELRGSGAGRGGLCGRTTVPSRHRAGGGASGMRRGQAGPLWCHRAPPGGAVPGRLPVPVFVKNREKSVGVPGAGRSWELGSARQPRPAARPPPLRQGEARSDPVGAQLSVQRELGSSSGCHPGNSLVKYINYSLC